MLAEMKKMKETEALELKKSLAQLKEEIISAAEFF